MNDAEVLRTVDAIHRDKNIDKEIVFEVLEQAILSAARKHYGEEIALESKIDRISGRTTVIKEGAPIDSEQLGEILGRISAQSAKQVMIQKIREAERDAVFDEFQAQRGSLVNGTVTRFEGAALVVNIGKIEGILPKSEQIPGESFRPGDRVRAVILEVRKAGPRVRIVLSRVHSDLVRRLFELEIPEIGERVIDIRSLAREAGYRSKVAVSCFDQKIDAIGSCVGVRGSRIHNIREELAGEKIDIVRWNDSLQVLVPNALSPAEVEEVILCQMLGRVIVLVKEDQLSLAIGKRGQNVRLASKLVGWDIDIMTRDELNEKLDRALESFSAIPGAPPEMAENLIEQGFFTFDDLSVIELDQLAELSGLSEDECQGVVDFAEQEAERLEKELAAQKAAGTLPPKSAARGGADPVATATGTGEAGTGDAPVAVETESASVDSSASDQPEDSPGSAGGESPEVEVPPTQGDEPASS
jgi:N utilization substance protein A